MMTGTSEVELLRQRMDSVYMTVEEAREEIQRRWENKQLKQKVLDFIGDDIPEIFQLQPRAVLARQILSPNYEALDFLESAQRIGLEPVCFGYLEDKLVVKNLDKYFLCRLYFEDGTGKRGGSRVFVRKIIDFNQYDGSQIRDVVTLSGMNFVEFHQNLFRMSGADMEFFDASQYLHRHGETSIKYYRYLLALFICHGVLFENYLLSDGYRILTQEMFWPSFQEVTDYFKVKPMIVRLVHQAREEDEHWRHYPGALLAFADTLLTRERTKDMIYGI